MKQSKEVRETLDAIAAVFSQFGISKFTSIESLGGVEYVRFVALHRGQFVPHWARVGRPLIRGGDGELAGSFAEALQGVAREEAYQYQAVSRVA